MLRTIKEDIVWPYDWDNSFDFEIALNKWISDYNMDYPHQALNNMTPIQLYSSCATISEERFLALLKRRLFLLIGV
jgi:hypothetical protein